MNENENIVRVNIAFDRSTGHLLIDCDFDELSMIVLFLEAVIDKMKRVPNSENVIH